MGDALDALGRQAHREAAPSHEFFMAAPGGVPTQVAFSQERAFEALDLDRATGVIRDVAHAFSKDGGLAVLYGNLAAGRLHREDGGRR